MTVWSGRGYTIQLESWSCRCWDLGSVCLATDGWQPTIAVVDIKRKGEYEWVETESKVEGPLAWQLRNSRQAKGKLGKLERRRRQGGTNDEEDGRRWREGQKQGWNGLWTEKSYYELQSAIRLEMMRWWAKQTLKLADLESRGQCPAESRRSGGLQCYILFCNLMISTYHHPVTTPTKADPSLTAAKHKHSKNW